MISFGRLETTDFLLHDPRVPLCWGMVNTIQLEHPFIGEERVDLRRLKKGTEFMSLGSLTRKQATGSLKDFTRCFDWNKRWKPLKSSEELSSLEECLSRAEMNSEIDLLGYHEFQVDLFKKHLV